MTTDFTWSQQFRLDVDFGFLSTQTHGAPRHHNPRIVLNDDGSTVLHEILSELRRCSSFTFSVAFVAPGAVAQLKQALVEFDGVGRIITSDYLGFNSPEAFAELHNLQALGIDVRLHNADGFHPKGYIFEHENAVTTMMGSSNLTPSALLKNHEWNLKVSASPDSDLAAQLAHLVELQVADSVPITQEWIEQYAKTYVRPAQRPPRVPRDVSTLVPHPTAPLEERSPSLLPTTITPNRMQRDALNALAAVRDSGEKRAIVISATGTGKTILSALDVRAVNPRRLLFVVHREQILDRTIQEYRKVLGGDTSDYGKLTGSSKDFTARYLFATVQTLAQPDVLARFPADVFDYVIVDEAHRGGSPTHRRVIGHFDPVFMLGMTATPERTDGFNVFELFHYNVPYEIRLNRALDEDMLTPFHYYGITDATFDDDTTVDALSDLDLLVSPQRVSHLIWALETYVQAGTAPRGLIFCSRTQEARRLSDVLNRSLLRGRPLRTASLTGADSIEHRERTVEQLESGELDYILTVDVFNEGVDIPSINQVIMLRQTQSAIVFVQQLGRGLRKCDQKEYLVVLDFIGNYANNFLIPIALFGDDSLNKESLRQNLIAAEEAGALPGLSSVQFDKIAQQRVLASIRDTKLDDMARLKAAVVAMRNRVGAVPRLWDFFRFESVDPVVLATKKEHYPALVRSLLKEEIDLPETSSRALQLLSHEVLPAKRGHEFVLLRALLDDGRLTSSQIDERFAAAGLPTSPAYVKSAVDTLTLDGFAEADVRRYGSGVAVRDGSAVTLTSEVASAYASPTDFPSAVDDIIDTGLSLVRKGFDPSARFTAGRQYSRKEALRQLCWPRSWASTVYGYKVDRASGACPIFVTLHKSDEISASTAYEDALLDASSMLWYTRSRRTLRSSEVQAIVSGDVALYVFVKKDDAEGTGFYFLGQASAHDAEETTMPDAAGNSLDVVRMILRFEKPVETALFDYFHSTLID